MIAILGEAAAPSSGNSNAYNDEKITTLNAQATEALTNAMIYGNHSRYLSVVQVTLNFTLNILHLRHTLKLLSQITKILS